MNGAKKKILLHVGKLIRMLYLLAYYQNISYSVIDYITLLEDE